MTTELVGMNPTRDRQMALRRLQVLPQRQDLDAGVEILTLGQYLQPTKRHLPVARWVHPDEFRRHRSYALGLGFAHCESGPLVRSSYHAHEHVK